MISDVVVTKPSRALNLVYVTFGYVLASYIVSPLELDSVQKLVSTLVTGGVFGTFLFYTKPVERFIMLLLLLSGKNESRVYLRSRQHTFLKTALFYSPTLAEERAKINGALFFSISILLSDRLLGLINIHLPFYILVFFAALMMAVAVWEGLIFVTRKMGAVAFYYSLVELGKPITKELKDAIDKKDWTYLNATVLRDVYIRRPTSSLGKGLCPICKTIENLGTFCPTCGHRLITSCNACLGIIVPQEMKEVPNYCIECGAPIKPFESNSGTGAQSGTETKLDKK